ncbi:Arginyl-tRNA--protein transferase, putative [Pediculus humanus corporis]|uniref:Arginyl-tRNA--protein transferase 1 n=1 Tax=Pediculus humanus subsp. corporis TaxID=121224 RepID=E0V904_PEDHC|nr:Arginyl-tRNA--protein transferase, putative [Pediculus humanus corporis]EEB09860.1 Arginyl-tRNA--protein transferase, putative [Pediculus humanus corporis]
MEDYCPSIVEYYSEQRKNNCGYCSSKDGSHTYGLYAHRLTVEDYQNMIDRGWRRCGTYCYKSIMKNTCCPLYTIRCEANDFKPSKTQKKLLRKFNNFLITGDIKKEKNYRNTEITQHKEMHYLNNDDKAVNKKFTPMNISTISTVDEIRSDEKISSVKTNSEKVSAECSLSQNTISEAKYLRIERKRQKLQNQGFTDEEIAKKLVEKKRYPVTKTLEDYLDNALPENQAHNFKISLVRSFPPSEEFHNTFGIVFDLYKRYQISVHKDLPISVKSPKFKDTFKESSCLFAKYQKAIHNSPDHDCDDVAYTDFLIDTPLEAKSVYGSYHQHYWLDNKLIAVGVIDILPKCVSSVYFFYDPDYSHLSLGTYGAELEFTRKLSSRFPDLNYYYMGFYIHSCIKIKYKAAFKPSFLLCPEVFTWHPYQDCEEKLNVNKYCRLNETSGIDVNSNNITCSDILILHNRTAMPLGHYKKIKKVTNKELDEIMEYAKLVGKLCSKNILLLRV